jgi:carbon-monoxide dehydrogenase iron sulfur subunit
MKMLLVHPEKCTGCRICELVCAYKHYKVNNPKKAAIRVTQLFPKPAANVPIVCRQCKVAPCIERCAELKFNALYKNDSGVTLVDAEKCVGDFACAEACPFAAVYIHPDLKTPIICDLCGGDPECVKHCPTNAIEFTTPIAAHQTRRTEQATKMASRKKK